MIDIHQHDKWVEDKHHLWYEYLNKWAMDQHGISVEVPSFELELTCSKRAGMYSRAKHQCIYTLPYIFVEGRDAYEITIAHEVVHAFQWSVMPTCATHGDFFLYMMRLVCKFPDAEVYHRYHVKKAKAISKLLLMQEQINGLSKDLA